MQFAHAVIADYAEIVGGKLYLMGGGWDRYWAAELPAQVRLGIAAGIRIEWEETNKPVPVVMVIEDDDGQQMVRIDGQVNVGRPPHLSPGSGQLAQMCANVMLSAPRWGGYRVRITAGEGPDAVEATLPVRVEERR